MEGATPEVIFRLYLETPCCRSHWHKFRPALCSTTQYHLILCDVSSGTQCAISCFIIGMQMKEWLVGSGRDYIRVGAMLRRSSALDGKVVGIRLLISQLPMPLPFGNSKAPNSRWPVIAFDLYMLQHCAGINYWVGIFYMPHPERRWWAAFWPMNISSPVIEPPLRRGYLSHWCTNVN